MRVGEFPQFIIVLLALQIFQKKVIVLQYEMSILHLLIKTGKMEDGRREKALPLLYFPGLSI